MVSFERLAAGLEKRNHLSHPYIIRGQSNKAFYPPFPLKDWEILEMYSELGELITPGMLALDLGSARGKLITALSIVGATAKGIDASQFLVNSSNAIAKQMALEGFIEPNSCIAHTGNYFPSDFKTSDDVKWDNWTEGERVLTSNPYFQMGLSLADFDLATVYQYEKNTPETLRLLSERCRRNTMVIVLSN